MARFHHSTHDGFGKPECRFEVCRHDRVPLVFLHPHQQVVARDPGVVDENGGRAEACLDVGYRGVDRGAI